MVHWGLDIGTTDTEAVSLSVQESESRRGGGSR